MGYYETNSAGSTRRKDTSHKQIFNEIAIIMPA